MLVARLLFVEREGDDVRLDVVVLRRAETPSSPEVGEPLCFSFTLPGDGESRDALERILQQWADMMQVIGIDLSERHGRTLVRLAAGDSNVILEPPTRAA